VRLDEDKLQHESERWPCESGAASCNTATNARRTACCSGEPMAAAVVVGVHSGVGSRVAGPSCGSGAVSAFGCLSLARTRPGKHSFGRWSSMGKCGQPTETTWDAALDAPLCQLRKRRPLRNRKRMFGSPRSLLSRGRLSTPSARRRGRGLVGRRRCRRRSVASMGSTCAHGAPPTHSGGQRDGMVGVDCGSWTPKGPLGAQATNTWRVRPELGRPRLQPSDEINDEAPPCRFCGRGVGPPFADAAARGRCGRSCGATAGPRRVLHHVWRHCDEDQRCVFGGPGSRERSSQPLR
jgi:hypothetical protein